jgi:hypothetical protein
VTFLPPRLTRDVVAPGMAPTTMLVTAGPKSRASMPRTWKAAIVDGLREPDVRGGLAEEPEQAEHRAESRIGGELALD